MTAATLERETTTLDQPETSNESTQASHIVKTPPWEEDETPQAYVLRSRIEGHAVIALCGHIFVPQQDPKPLPVCQTCLEIYENDPLNHNDRDELPEA